MSEQELQTKIDNLAQEINGLNLKKQKYESMNRKINEIISKLNEAKECISKAYSSMKTHYVSKVKSKEDDNFEGVRPLIDSQINKLKQVLNSSNQQINNINSRIQAKTIERNNYINQLNQLLSSDSSSSSSPSSSSSSSSTSQSGSSGSRNRGQTR